MVLSVSKGFWKSPYVPEEVGVVWGRVFRVEVDVKMVSAQTM